MSGVGVCVLHMCGVGIGVVKSGRWGCILCQRWFGPLVRNRPFCWKLSLLVLVLALW
jgi:hypothetical protein